MVARSTFVLPLGAFSEGRLPGRYTLEEWYELNARRDEKFEYFDGFVVCMSGGSKDHATITSNIHGALFAQLSGKPCRARPESQAIAVSARQFRFADVSVACPPQFVDIRGFDCLANPTVIVEVLSASTREFDEGDKLADWLRIPSVRHVLLIEPDRPLVRHFTPGIADARAHETLSMHIELPEVGGTLTGRDIYLDASWR
ncbi:MAG: Uma2 family endonuclease [Labilithrix sp.]|nr:Uma2 family endonuclease [Labilithrix sp.]MCW5816357.1 Uma2 family endonuclease [Labilithrix sp.]